MKIAFLSFYSGMVDRGVEVANGILAQKLSQKHDVTLFQAGNNLLAGIKTIKFTTEVTWPPDSSQSFWRRFYLDLYSLKILKFTLKFMVYLFREKYDVVNPTNGGWQVMICRLTTWLLGRKMIVQGNAGIGRDDLWQMLWLPNMFIAISSAGYQWAKKKAPWVKSSYIPYGVDIDKFNSIKPIPLNIEKPIVLCVSAFLPYKQIELLIYAMQYVPKASLLLIGQGPLLDKLKQLGNKLLKNRFVLKINIGHEALIQYYKSVDIFSLPSKSTEALGIVYIEALAAGLPVVAPNDENRRQMVGDAGILVDPTNIPAYASALNKALKTDFSDKPIKQAKKFSWAKIMLQYEDLLQSL